MLDEQSCTTSESFLRCFVSSESTTSESFLRCFVSSESTCIMSQDVCGWKSPFSARSAAIRLAATSMGNRQLGFGSRIPSQICRRAGISHSSLGKLHSTSPRMTFPAVNMSFKNGSYSASFLAFALRRRPYVFRTRGGDDQGRGKYAEYWKSIKAHFCLLGQCRMFIHRIS